jgi:NitT/TauT family transport system substrate-binding protein
MRRITLSLLRGVCQMPAYAAKDMGLFERRGLDVRIQIAATAFTVPDRLVGGEVDFAVIPWTRVVAANAHGGRLLLVCGSGCEEAAIVVRRGLPVHEVGSIAVPQEGGIKDLTARALMQSLGWEGRTVLRLPSGDGAILAFVGRGADAASMVEPYATMLEELGMGTVVRRTGDVWPGAPGCSLATSARLAAEDPNLVQQVVEAFVDGAARVLQAPDEASVIAARYIGMDAAIIRKALDHNRPNVDALRSRKAMDDVLGWMIRLGYVDRLPADYVDLRHVPPPGQWLDAG